ncbi:hypothetical protein ARALYDRAFT_915065 [Arabidopsis lyrata subsp. lyrata]|uniref:Uncharacterized protein n=1 Tax=Arabidopsis lyrata subsp. lyrata TaxID=81972 RepID=D7MCE2_ARALL|nr:hypothetical protein ARALYDRAFT_915065 [Arabidopsis lyrata subsp. lyrata]
MGTMRKALYNVGFWIRETGQALDRLGCRLQGKKHFREHRGGSSCRSEPYASLRSVKRQKQLDPKHSEIAAVVRSDCETMAAGFNMDYGDYRGDGEAVLYPRLLVIVEVMERLFLYPRLFGF